MSPIALQIFLCHSSSDKDKVRELYQRLEDDGFKPWLDAEDLIPGQEWQVEIPKAVRESDIVIICLSNNSISKSGYIQREIKFALDVADEKAEGTIFLIPLKLEECKVPDRLANWQWVNYFDETGYEKLLKALKTRAIELGLLLDKYHIDQSCSPWSDMIGSEIAVQFTPSSFPQKLKNARFYVTRGAKPRTEFEVRVYKDENSKPGDRLDLGNIRASAKMGSEWVNVDLSSQNIILEDGSFFISMYWSTAPGLRGVKAQSLAAQFVKEGHQGYTCIKWAHKGVWAVDKDRSFFVEVAFESGIVQKAYFLDE